MGSRLNLHRWFSPTCLILAMLFSALRAEPETTISELRSEIESLRMRILSLEDKGFSGIRGNSSELESLGKMLGSTSFGIEIPKGFQVELGKAAVVAESRVRFGKRTFRNSKNFRSWRLVFVGIARHAKENNQSKIIVLHEDSREIVWEMQISNDRRIEFIDVGSVVSANGITEMDIIVVDDTGLMERFQIQWKKVVIAETSTTRQGSKSKRFRLKTQATVLSHESTHERNQISQIDYGDKSLEMLRRTGVTRHENVCLENSLAFAGYIKSWSQRSGVPTRLDINSSVLTSKRYRSIEYMLKLSFSGEIIIEKIVKYAGLPRLDDNKTEVYRAFIASSQNPLRTAPLTFEHSARKVMVILTSSDLHILSLDLKLRADPRILHFSCSLPQFRNSVCFNFFSIYWSKFASAYICLCSFPIS